MLNIRLAMLVYGEIKSCLTSFKSFVLIPSGPLLFLADISLIILSMTYSETKENLKRELVELSKQSEYDTLEL